MLDREISKAPNTVQRLLCLRADSWARVRSECSSGGEDSLMNETKVPCAAGSQRHDPESDLGSLVVVWNEVLSNLHRSVSQECGCGWRCRRQLRQCRRQLRQCRRRVWHNRRDGISDNFGVAI
jgi:hypothetical protein